MAKAKEARKKLSQGRPPYGQRSTRSLSAKSTRTLIRSHHQLHKALSQATRDGDRSLISALERQVEEQGGLKAYQEASLQGQARDRGGDTSKVLLEWLDPRLGSHHGPLRLLEVGALSTTNECSRSPRFTVTCIDLHSQAEGILQQDFMTRPIPASSAQKFEVVSLSLVVNYVPDAAQRGEMLRRTSAFLAAPDDLSSVQTESPVFPCVFLVLPEPCLHNSRYMDEATLSSIMQSFGYSLTERKCSAKLIYFLWSWKGLEHTRPQQYPKRVVNPGKVRNNFSIVLP